MGEPLVMTRDLFETLRAHAEEGYPNEVVGLLAGRGRRVARVQPLVNERTDEARRRYAVGPLVLLRAQEALEAEGLEILGYYHSHPDCSAQYSAYDRDHALPNLSYVIASVCRGALSELRSWRLRGDRSAMDPEPIELLE